jgi:hypothetical protein
MVKRTVKGNDSEPEQKQFEVPSEKEHLFQVVDFIDNSDPNIVLVKLEVVGGAEEGRSILQRLSLDDTWKGFFATRIFLKAIGEEYKGNEFAIDTDNWVGRQFYATVVHNGKYANLKEYNFDKKIEQTKPITKTTTDGSEIAWDEGA